MTGKRKQPPSLHELQIEDWIENAFEFDAVPSSQIGARDNRNQPEKVSNMCAHLLELIDNSQDPAQSFTIQDRLNTPYAIVRGLTQKKVEATELANQVHGVVNREVLGNTNHLIEQSLNALGNQTNFITQAATNQTAIGLAMRNVTFAILATNRTEFFETLIHIMETAENHTSRLGGASIETERGTLRHVGRTAAWGAIEEWKNSNQYRFYPFCFSKNPALEAVLHTGFSHVDPSIKCPGPYSLSMGPIPQLGPHVGEKYRKALGLVTKAASKEWVQPTLPDFIPPSPKPPQAVH